jgi:probable addiction module antidote protein
MVKTTKTYSQWRQEKLTDPERAARYLNAAHRESREAFLHAIKNVIQANQVTKIAKEVGMARESVYRSFSAEGNPAFYMIDAVMKKLDINIEFNPVVRTTKAPPAPAPAQVSAPARTTRHAFVSGRTTSPRRSKTRKLSMAPSAGVQLAFNFTIATSPAAVPAVQQSRLPDYVGIAGNSASLETFLPPDLSNILLERDYGYARGFNAVNDNA